MVLEIIEHSKLLSMSNGAQYFWLLADNIHIYMYYGDNSRNNSYLHATDDKTHTIEKRSGYR